MRRLWGAIVTAKKGNENAPPLLRLDGCIPCGRSGSQMNVESSSFLLSTTGHTLQSLALDLRWVPDDRMTAGKSH